MNYSVINENLSSHDTDLILEALYTVGGERMIAPPEQTMSLAASHLRHPDADVRRQAVFAVAIHWASTSVFGTLCDMVVSEEDDDVVTAMLAGIRRLANAESSLTCRALGCLREFCNSELRSRRLRTCAYVEARFLVGEIDRAAYAKFEPDVSVDVVDVRWFDTVIERYNSSASSQ